MIRSAFALILIAAVSASAAPVPKELKKTDSARMKGLWKESSGTRWFFDDGKLYAGGSDTEKNKGNEYTLVLREDVAIREFDLVAPRGGGAVQFRGIYKFADEELTIVYVSGMAERPKDFAPGGGKFIHVLKRVAEPMK